MYDFEGNCFFALKNSKEFEINEMTGRKSIRMRLN